MIALLLCAVLGAARPEVSFTRKEGRVDIAVRGQPFATYVFKDADIPRPYFQDVRGPDGALLTRNHPPIEGKDPVDHATIHPGVWMSFGDLGGQDFWRNRARTEHERFVHEPSASRGQGSFTAANRYVGTDGKVIARETFAVTVRVVSAGILLLWDSRFSPEGDQVIFGDQEEMGLGMRVATALAVKGGQGRILNSDGLVNEKGLWGKTAGWIDYGGPSGGILMVPDPGNFRPSWFHARDYGALVANPFGRNAFTRGEKSAVVVRKGDSLRLRYGLVFHRDKVDLAAAHKEVLDAMNLATRQRLYVSFTMDCERLAAECSAGGTPSWEVSERAIRGYADTLLAAGIQPTLFLTPECGERHADLLKALQKRGVELGMHMHPQCFGDHRYSRYLAEYGPEDQREILSRGADVLTRALGVRPRSFRGGNFSASDETFPILADLGFRQGSVSDPGRDMPAFGARWRGAYPHAHAANAKNRLIPGDLDFLECPLTTDPDAAGPSGHPPELRLERGPFDTYQRPILDKMLRHMADEEVTPRVISIFTHNSWDYTDRNDSHRKTLDDYIRYLDVLRETYDLAPATLQAIHQLVSRDGQVVPHRKR